VCEVVCRPVQETRYKTVTRTVCKPVCETVMRTVCKQAFKECTETVLQTRSRTVCEEVCTVKTVTRRIPEMRCETYTVPGCVKMVCVPQYKCYFDPCTCQMVQKPCGSKIVLQRGPCETRTRQVCTYRTVCEQVPCKKMIHRQICEKVPVTVCKKIPYTVVEKVPMQVTRMVKEKVVEQIPYVCTKMVKEVVKKQVPYTTCRIAKGCYCDAGSCAGLPPGSVIGTGEDGPGKVFIEGGVCARTVQHQTVRMVQEQRVERVPHTVTRMVQETVVKRVPYQVTKMVPTVVEKCVPVTTCRMVQETHVKQVPTKVCTMKQEVVCKRVPICTTKMVPYTVTTKVPYKVTECVPTVECKRIPVCKEYEVTVKKPRIVCEETPVKAAKPCFDKVNCLDKGFGTSCDPCGKPGLLDRLFNKLKCRSNEVVGEPVITSPIPPSTIAPPQAMPGSDGTFEPIAPPKR
jgi:hypothetical protein